MAVSPTAPPAGPAAGPTAPPAKPTPAFKRVEEPAESLDGIACVAMITGKPLAEALKFAIERFKLRPTNGSYSIEESRLQILLETYGFVAGTYREIATISDLPDLYLVWQDTDRKMEFGRVLLFHHMKDFGNPKQTFAYVIDPAPQTDPSQCIR